MCTELQKALIAMGTFSFVDVFDASAGTGQTPSLAFLQQYDAALVFSGGALLDPKALGDVLAKYFDGGGRVVMTIDAFGHFGLLAVTGTFGTVANGYILLGPGALKQGNDLIGTIAEPQSSLMTDVKSLTNGKGVVPTRHWNAKRFHRVARA